MLNLEKIIKKLQKDHFDDLEKKLVKSKSQKFLILLSSLRKKSHHADESIIQSELDVSDSAYYTLKSRLFSKIQDSLFENIFSGNLNDALKLKNHISAITENSPRELSIPILLKLESVLIERGLFEETLNIYKELRKIHSFSPKFYDYDRKYNEHLSFIVAKDLIEQKLYEFNGHLRNFLLSGDKDLAEILEILRIDIHSKASNLNCPQAKIISIIVDLLSVLFLDLEESFEEQTQKAEKIIEMNREALTRDKYDLVIAFLKLISHYNCGFQKKFNTQFGSLQFRLPELDAIQHFVPVPFLLLMKAKLKFFSEEETSKEIVFFSFDDQYGIFCSQLFLAIKSIEEKNFSIGINILNNLLNSFNFKSFLHSEIEAKILLCILYKLNKKYDQGLYTSKNLLRKLKDGYEKDYEHALALLNAFSFKFKLYGKSSKPLELYDRFLLLNKDKRILLPYLSWTDELREHLMIRN